MKKQRNGDATKTNWEKEPFMKKNSSYEEKIRHLEQEIDELRSRIRLAEVLLDREYPEMENAISILKTYDGVSPWNWQDRCNVDNFADGNMFDDIQEFYDYLQGKSIPHGFENLITQKLTPDEAWEIIYVLQEGMRIIPDHFEKCDICGDLYDTDNSGRYSELEEKNFCDGCYDEGETTYCDGCGAEVWQEKSRTEDGDYLCEACKKKHEKDEE
jgi:hypothetical protein